MDELHLTDDDLWRMWREAGGSFNGPYLPGGRVGGYMENPKLLAFLRSFAAHMRTDEQKRLTEHHVFHATCPKCGSAVDVIPTLADEPT
jgi:hypothetical protein